MCCCDTDLLSALKGEAFGCNPDLVLQKINESLSKNFGEKSFRIYLEEQSDKNYNIVLAVSEGLPTRVLESVGH
jgi:hypothetical protein